MSCVFIFTWFTYSTAQAYQYHGRAAVGGFTSKENFKDEDGQDEDAESRVLSSRLYYQAEHFWREENNNSFTFDLRDKHDFFDKLDREKLELTGKNTVQLRELSLRTRPQGSRWELEAGRFNVMPAGASFTDGGRLGYKMRAFTYFGAFGGFNPHKIDRSNLEFDKDARNFGAYHHYEPRYVGWERRFVIDNAVVSEWFKSEVDRQYYYHNSFYQWRTGHFISNMIYFDFEPETRLQNAISHYQGTWKDKWQLGLGVMVLDTIEYKRQQDLLEELKPSPYREGNIDVRYKLFEHIQPLAKFRFGQREDDSLKRTDITVGANMPRILNDKTDFYVKLSQKKEFTKEGTFVGGGVTYFSRLWEVDLSLDSGVEETTDNETLHPFVLDLSAGYQPSRSWLTAFGVQLAQNEDVDVYSAFFKVTYRFGNSEVPPVRDGSPPQGPL